MTIFAAVYAGSAFVVIIWWLVEELKHMPKACTNSEVTQQSVFESMYNEMSGTHEEKLAILLGPGVNGVNGTNGVVNACDPIMGVNDESNTLVATAAMFHNMAEEMEVKIAELRNSA